MGCGLVTFLLGGEAVQVAGATHPRRANPRHVPRHAHYEKIALRLSLRTPYSKPTRALEVQSPAHSRKPTKPNNEDTDAGETYCCYHGKNKGHENETLECSLFTHWGAEICEQYRERRLCFFAAAGKCTKGDACRNKHADPEVIKELQVGNPQRDTPKSRPRLIYSAQNSDADEEIGPRQPEPPRGDGVVPTL